MPAIAPPWGTLNAIDLATGDLLWKVPLGEYPQLVAKGIRNTGSLNFGGAVATAGGVIFIAATADEKIRAFEKASGRVLWEYQLPAGGYATPSVYMIDGHEYVAIAAGGSGKNATKSGDSIIAFALPDKEPQPTDTRPASNTWIDLFDGSTLNGWVQMNGAHRFNVEDGAIVGRTVESQREPELLPVHDTGLRRLRARARNRHRSDHQLGHSDQKHGAPSTNDREKLRVCRRPGQWTAG